MGRISGDQTVLRRPLFSFFWAFFDQGVGSIMLVAQRVLEHQCLLQGHSVYSSDYMGILSPKLFYSKIHYNVRIVNRGDCWLPILLPFYTLGVHQVPPEFLKVPQKTFQKTPQPRELEPLAPDPRSLTGMI